MIIATRTLHVMNGAISRKSFDVRLYQPTRDGKSWSCRYEIDWPRGTRRSAGHGVDGIQAISTAMQKIGVELYTSPYHLAGTLLFDKVGNGYGFAVPKPMRGLLIGDDAKFGGD